MALRWQQVVALPQSALCGRLEAHASAANAGSPALPDPVGLFADLFNKRLPAEERRQLVGLVEGVARIDGPSAIQTSEINVLKRRVGLTAVG